MIIILVITKHLKSYLETFITKNYYRWGRKKTIWINAIIGALENYIPRTNKYTEAKNKLLNNVKKIYKGREKIIEGFKNRIFPFDYDEAWEE